MNTLLSTTRPDEQDRLNELDELTRDIRVAFTDRVALRIGLWLLLRGERNARDRADRDARDQRALARDEYVRAARDAALTRAAVTLQYR